MGPGAFRELDCNAPESEQVAQVAVDYINSNRKLGYKYTWNRIEKVKVWSRVSEVTVQEIGELQLRVWGISKEDIFLQPNRSLL